MDVKIDDDGFCKTFTTIGSGVAGEFFIIIDNLNIATCSSINLGAVHGIGGGIFTLLSLACK